MTSSQGRRKRASRLAKIGSLVQLHAFRGLRQEPKKVMGTVTKEPNKHRRRCPPLLGLIQDKTSSRQRIVLFDRLCDETEDTCRFDCSLNMFRHGAESSNLRKMSIKLLKVLSEAQHSDEVDDDIG